ncbi:hypothetical protein SAMN06297144_1578 [Sphingomonas guangdongensis]|uniref:Heat induced stress protein YflT n=1 Tax=Sphingomonas guangdongensis TaxID=1141890 RepID=A0A285QX24_9SPHN|nr:hypothetical protein [Sphingomonas guangdongensis]SOB86473.1 hypothetical protein SAMN06297144_1578 [Sphingomonas guangdongensis]
MIQSIASAVFDSETDADHAIAELRQAGVPDSSLSIIAQENGRTTTTSGTGETHGDGHGSIVRGLIGGGALGAGLGVAALAIPGVGPLAALGAIAASAVPEAVAIGAAAGAVAGGLNESRQKHGISEADAGYYQERIGGGGTLVSIDSTATVDRGTVSDILYRNGGHNSTRAATTATAAPIAY